MYGNKMCFFVCFFGRVDVEIIWGIVFVYFCRWFRVLCVFDDS